MIYVEAPSEIHDEDLNWSILFLAGGITGCPDWQSVALQELTNSGELILVNPRRLDFPIHDPSAAEAQILWEHRMLRKADAILFWFPCETLCPIVLYELGAWSMTQKPLFVGCHPEYKRRQDVEIQTRLVRPEVKVHDRLEDVVFEARLWIRSQTRERCRAKRSSSLSGVQRLRKSRVFECRSCGRSSRARCGEGLKRPSTGGDAKPCHGHDARPGRRRQKVQSVTL